MVARTKRIPLLIGVGVLLVGAHALAQEAPAPSATESLRAPNLQTAPRPAAAEGEPEPEDPFETAFASLDLRQKVAQLMLVTLQGQRQPRSDDLAFIDRYLPGGVLVMRLLNPAAATTYVTKLRGAEASSGIPMFIGTNLYDLVRPQRDVPSAFMQLPSLLAVAASHDLDVAASAGGILASQARDFGFSFHFGPSLELASSLDGAQGSIYRFGQDAQFTADAAWAILSEMQRAGVIAVPTGFPGGGTNRVDGDPAVLSTPISVLGAEDLLPYRHVIEQGVQMLHVGNVLVPTLDPESRPASVSPQVLSRLLRDTLAFEGMAIAGPMDGADLQQLYDPADASIASLAAGADMLLWTGPLNQVMRTVDRITTAIEDGTLDQAALEATVRRVLEFKFELATSDETAGRLAEVGAYRRERRRFNDVYAIERQSIALVKNTNGVVPLSESRSMPLGVTGVFGVENLGAELERHMKPISTQSISTAKHMGDIADFEIERITRHIRGIRTVVLVLEQSMRPRGQMLLIRALKEKDIQVVVVLLGFPDTLPYLAEADAIVLAFCDPAHYPQTMRAVADVLVGLGPVNIVEANAPFELAAGQPTTFDAMDVVRVPIGRLPVGVGPFPAGLALPYDPREAIRRASWDFGDGQRDRDLRVTHAYREPGRYPLTLTVEHRNGEETTREFAVVVR